MLGAERVVSINQCTDELLLALADPEQIQSVTFFVQDPDVSWDAPAAQTFPANQGTAEEVLAYQPDLVLAGDFSSRQTVGILRALNVRVEEIPHPQSIADVYANIRRVASLVGRADRGEMMIATLRSKLVGAQQVGIRAAIYQPNGYTTGGGSLVGELLAHAGLTNAADERGLRRYARYPLELLIWDTPDLLILDPQTRAAPSLAHQVLDHPALQRVFRRVDTVSMPPQAWACGNHHVVFAVARLRAVARRIEGRKRGRTEG